MSTALQPQSTVLPWRSAVPALVVLLAAILLVYRDTALAMVAIWYRSETFTHGFVVLPIVLWLVWRRRSIIAARLPQPSPWLAVGFAGLALMWLLGDLVGVNSITQLAMVAMMVTAVPAVLGFSVAATITFPLAFMFFAVPIGEFVMPQLMDWTADFTIAALRLSGVPVFREGLNFVIPTGSWSVVEACSGVRYLIASLTVGTLYAYLNYQSTGRRILFMLVSMLVPIVANWLRAYMIVMLGHLSGNKIAVGVDHLIYGWVFFGVVILLMFFIGARWSEPEPTAVGPAHVVPAANAGPPVATRFWFSALAFAVIVSLPMFAKQALEPQAGAMAPRLELAEAGFQPWQLGDAASIGFKPHYDEPSAELNQVYVNGARSVGVYIGYYRDQSYTRKLVTSTNTLVRSNDRAWGQVRQGAVPVEMAGASTTARYAELRRMAEAPAHAPERLLAWQIYWINGRLTSNDYLAKVYSAAYQLIGRGDDSAVLVFYTPKDGSDTAQDVLAGFVASQYGGIDKALRAVADGRQP
jgi:exosortase A